MEGLRIVEMRLRFEYDFASMIDGNHGLFALHQYYLESWRSRSLGRTKIMQEDYRISDGSRIRTNGCTSDWRLKISNQMTSSNCSTLFSHAEELEFETERLRGC